MARVWALMPLVVAAALGLAGSAASVPQQRADLSLTFQELGPVLTAPALGLPADESLANPNAALLPDGRIRLYYGRTGSAQPPGFFSAVSSDGVHFTPEAGQRWFSTSGDVERLPDGRWRLYYPHDDAGGALDGVASATSTDGLTFADEFGLRMPNPIPGGKSLSRPGVVRLPDGRYRMYVTARASNLPPPPPFQIFSATSADLANWAPDAGTRQTGGSAPAALLAPDGSVLLVFNAELRLGAGPPSYISTAIAPDGLAFDAKVATNIGGAHPSFVSLPDGRLLMYYDSGDPATISAAVTTLVGPPAVSYPAQAVTDITASSARVSATLDPHGADTHYVFQYGESTDYGHSTDEQSVTATGGSQTVSETLTDLAPATAYHFRAHAFNAPGVADGADRTFTTEPAKPHVTQKLAGSVGPGATISFPRTARAGRTVLTIRDRSPTDNFHLSGPGVNKRTGVRATGTSTWAVTLQAGTYTFRSDAHAKLRGTTKIA